MIGIVVTGHLNFASGMKSAVDAIIGEIEGVEFVDYITSISPESLTKIFENVISKYDEVLFLVDLLGGTPCNVASNLIFDHENVDVITGANLPMIVNAALEKDSVTLPELTELVACVASASIKNARELIKKDKSECEDNTLF